MALDSNTGQAYLPIVVENLAFETSVSTLMKSTWAVPPLATSPRRS
jgi:hypothetical protein